MTYRDRVRPRRTESSGSHAISDMGHIAQRRSGLQIDGHWRQGGRRLHRPLDGPDGPRFAQVTTGDTGEETAATVNGQATDARSSEAVAAPDASSKRLDETTSSVDPKSRVGRV